MRSCLGENHEGGIPEAEDGKRCAFGSSVGHAGRIS